MRGSQNSQPFIWGLGEGKNFLQKLDLYDLCGDNFLASIIEQKTPFSDRGGHDMVDLPSQNLEIALLWAYLGTYLCIGGPS